MLTSGLAGSRGSRRSSDSIRGILLGAVSALAMASLPIWAVRSYQLGLDWLSVLYWRFAIGTAVIWVIALLWSPVRHEVTRLARRRIVVLLALGALFVAEAGSFYAALEHIPVSLATLVSYSTLGLVALLSRRYARSLGPTGWLALGSASLGVIVAVGVPSGQVEALGVLLALGSAASHAAWAVLTSREGGERRTASVAGTSPVPAIAVMSTGTLLGLGILLTGRGGHLLPSSVPPAAWASLLPLGVLSVIGISFWYAATRRIGVARATIVSAGQLAVTMVLAAAVLHETVGLGQVAGAGLIVVAIVLLGNVNRENSARTPVGTLPAADDVTHGALANSAAEEAGRS